VFPIQIPALRERGGDIVILARHFVEKFARELNKPALKLSTEAIDVLCGYPWPGTCASSELHRAGGDSV
jgi:transcriptional regulator with GAF, ATPase, and Fis domain